MLLSEFKEHVAKWNDLHEDVLRFKLPNGHVPEHFHITEVGVSDKRFVDCGGYQRQSTYVCFQLWTADDYDHRLSPKKLSSIIEAAEKSLKPGDWLVQVEYQAETIGIWGVEFKDGVFCLTPTKTDCLAKDKCGIPVIQNDCCSGADCC